MWIHLLKKDLVKQAGVHAILFLFITLSTVFLASSVSNIILVLGGLDYYMECANVSDVTVFLGTGEEVEEFAEWLDGRREVAEYALEQMCHVNEGDVEVVKEGHAEPANAVGIDLYLGYAGGVYMKPLDNQGNGLEVEEGEVALPIGFLTRNGLKVGDGIRVKVGGETYEYRIGAQCKDILFGNELAGMNRFVFCRADYDRMTGDTWVVRVNVYGFNSEDAPSTVDAMNRRGFRTLMNTVRRDIYPMMYVFEMIVAALLIAIGICLILISLMILRFSLMFTMEESYREIGIMKAVGIRNFSIRKIYFMKYLVPVAAGALAGLLLSIPVGSFMAGSVSGNMVLGDGSGTFGVSMLSALAEVVFVVGMCILFTRKVNRLSAVEAIRSGDGGQRYHRRSGLRLYRKKRMGTASFLGLNDILCNRKRYMVLFLSFCISFVLITIPLNTLTTMESREMVSKFNLNPESAIFMEKLEREGDVPYHSVSELKQAMERVREELAGKGYDVQLSVGMNYTLEFTVDDEGRTIKPLTNYPIGRNGGWCEYEEGYAPMLENEVAFSKKLMEENDLHIGDSVTGRIGGKERKFLITGYYSDYMQLGKSVRLNPTIDMEGEIALGYWKVTVDMDTDLTQEELAEKLGREFPEYRWITAEEALETNLGSVKDTMRAMRLPMTVMLCVLIMLISALMMQLFIVREKGQLAMMKSIGFSSRYIRMWLVMRMVWVVVLSMVLAVPLSALCNRYVLRPIFAIMGAELTIQVDPLKAYLLYPGVLLAGIAAATVFATGSVVKIDVGDMKIAE